MTSLYFAVGNGYAVYRGPTASGPFHRHAAFQIAIGVAEEVTIVDHARTHHRAAALLVPPMVRHRMVGSAEVLTFYIEPHSVFADGLRPRGENITAATDLRELRESDIGPEQSGTLDPRLVDALNLLRDKDIPMPEVAAAVALSPQRLRALARQQVGMPLARWRIWARLRVAAEELQAGRSVADAASAAGFADQAHLTRRMREMIGLTPANALPALRAHARSAT